MRVEREVNVLSLTNEEVLKVASAVEEAWEGWHANDTRQGTNPYDSIYRQFTDLREAISSEQPMRIGEK